MEDLDWGQFHRIVRLMKIKESEIGLGIDWEGSFSSYGFDLKVDNWDRIIHPYSGVNDGGLTELPYITDLFFDAYLTNKENAIKMIRKIFEDDLGFLKYDFEEYPWLMDFLSMPKNQETSEINEVEIYNNSNFYLNINMEQIPDPFYVDLIDLINKCHFYKIYDAVFIFNRKLIENLIIEILRNHYGLNNLESTKKYYNINRGRFHNFQTLLDNFKGCINEFKPIEPNLKDIIEKIVTFKNSANKTTHSIIINMKKEDVEKVRETLNDVVKTLIRIIQIQRTNIH